MKAVPFVFLCFANCIFALVKKPTISAKKQNDGKITVSWKYPEGKSKPAYVHVYVLAEAEKGDIVPVKMCAVCSSDQRSYTLDPAEMSIKGRYYIAVTSEGIPTLGPGRANAFGAATAEMLIGKKNAGKKHKKEDSKKDDGKMEDSRKEDEKMEDSDDDDDDDDQATSDSSTDTPTTSACEEDRVEPRTAAMAVAAGGALLLLCICC